MSHKWTANQPNASKFDYFCYMTGSHTVLLLQSGQNHWTHKHSVQVPMTRRLQKFFFIFFPLARARHASDHTEHNRSSSPFHDSSLKEQNALKDRNFWNYFSPLSIEITQNLWKRLVPNPFRAITQSFADKLQVKVIHYGVVSIVCSFATDDFIAVFAAKNDDSWGKRKWSWKGIYPINFFSFHSVFSL